ncbi:MAG: ABC transporter permease subunit/CPBP intramembrane protease [Planctomycetota bacterium]
MTARNVRLVFAKEMRDTLRDRRTLFISIVLPILLYPVLMIGFSQVLMKKGADIAGRSQPVAIARVDLAPDLADRLRAGAEEAKYEVVTSEDPAADLAAGVIEAWVEPDEAFDGEIEGGRQGHLAIHFDSTRDASAQARKKIGRVLYKLSREVMKERGLSEADIEPIDVTPADKASTEQRGAKQFGPLLALMLVVMALSGAFYPAIDIMAGEKERGTMETLLVCPATRTEVVFGKYLTVLTMTVFTALLNFASMAITFSHFAGMMPAGRGDMSLSISPFVGVVIVIALLPIAGLFSAVALAMSTFARTYKEGQHYLTPLFIAVMPLAMVALIPETKLDSFALIPVAGAVLLVRDLMLGTASGADIFQVLLATASVAAIAIWWTVSMFNREDVLFRDPGGSEFTLIQRATKPGSVPTPGQAMLLATGSLALVFFIVPRFMANPAVGFLIQQLGLTLGLAILAAWWYRLDPVKTFRLGRPRSHLSLLAVVIGAPSVLVLTMFVHEVSGVAEGSEETLEHLAKALEQIKDTLGIWPLFLIPPVVEELFFRGFVLSAFRKRARPWVAVLVTALLFALFHLEPTKLLTTGLIGIWLGYVCVATGSVWPAILAHLINNSILFLEDLENVEIPAWPLPAAVVGLAVAVWLLERIRRAEPDPDAG